MKCVILATSVLMSSDLLTSTGHTPLFTTRVVTLDLCENDTCLKFTHIIFIFWAFLALFYYYYD